VFNPKNTPIIGRKGQLPNKIKCRTTPFFGGPYELERILFSFIVELTVTS